MIRLHTFGEAFGLPDPSPFVIKAQVLLKLCGQAYQTEPFAGGLKIGPKGKRPFIVDEGVTIADSTLIRFHLERKYGHDFDEKLSAREKGLSWAVEKMCEEHLYFALLYFRWMYQDNFERGPAQFFEKVPVLVRPLVKKMAIHNARKTLHYQGFGRHTQAELILLSQRDINALAAILGDREWFGGASPCAADASATAFLMSTLCEHFAAPTLDCAQSHPNLVAYAQRAQKLFFSEPLTDVVASASTV